MYTLLESLSQMQLLVTIFVKHFRCSEDGSPNGAALFKWLGVVALQKHTVVVPASQKLHGWLERRDEFRQNQVFSHSERFISRLGVSYVLICE